MWLSHGQVQMPKCCLLTFPCLFHLLLSFKRSLQNFDQKYKQAIRKTGMNGMLFSSSAGQLSGKVSKAYSQATT